MNNKLIKTITRVGVLTAIIIIAKQLVITIPIIGRLDLTHFITILTGFIFGPLIGGLSGFLGDFFGGVLKGWAAFPIIFPWGHMLIGIIAGLMSRNLKNKFSLLISVLVMYLLTHFVIEFITYITYFKIFGTRFETFNQAAIIYYPIRLTKSLVLLPTWLIIIPIVYNNLKRVRD